MQINRHSYRILIFSLLRAVTGFDWVSFLSQILLLLPLVINSSSAVQTPQLTFRSTSTLIFGTLSCRLIWLLPMSEKQCHFVNVESMGENEIEIISKVKIFEAHNENRIKKGNFISVLLVFMRENNIKMNKLKYTSSIKLTSEKCGIYIWFMIYISTFE